MLLVAGSVDTFDAELADDPSELARLLDVSPIVEWPPAGGEHDDDAVEYFRASLLQDSDSADWLAFYVCVDDTLVGSAGFLGPPQDGVTEIGYSICKRFRNRGFASRAVGLLTDKADRAGVRRLIARAHAQNAASIAVLEGNGFTCLEADRAGTLSFSRTGPSARPG